MSTKQTTSGMDVSPVAFDQPQLRPVAPAPGSSARLVPVAAALVLGALLMGGCASPAPAAPANSIDLTTTNIDEQLDPCAEQLHDICGPLLAYYAVHQDLPARLDQLPLPKTALVCPISKKPYVYNPHGMPLADREGLLIVYDAKASHLGTRWAILAEPPKPGKPLVLRVLRPNEAAIRWKSQVPAGQSSPKFVQ